MNLILPIKINNWKIILNKLYFFFNEMFSNDSAKFTDILQVENVKINVIMRVS